VGGQDLAGVERDDRDLPLVGDGQDARAGVGRADVEVVQAAGPAQGDRTLAVGSVVRRKSGSQWNNDNSD